MRRGSRALGVVFAAALLGGCSSSDADEAKAYWQDYCTRLGSWQEARNSVDAFPKKPGSAADGGAGALAPGVISAAEVLDRKGGDEDSARVLDDTVAAVTGADLRAEGRVVSSCDRAGFETAVK
ncbi:hypothetical protein [Streptomyces sp. TLI_105]|uniref:hypothetical protein n=1 Tax=Streptomyces sp. TLI_105 TaxID=1881019 RepID=UPI00089750B2|nr:hypothetical protein [Streptomyces sp. TLI_105]SEC79298.1 hypothetical protein SAMN05428939_3295 [Streptomyces sp. TLI_105]